MKKIKLIIIWSVSVGIAYFLGYFVREIGPISLDAVAITSPNNPKISTEYKKASPILTKQDNELKETEVLPTDQKSIIAEVISLLSGDPYFFDLASVSKAYSLVSKFSEQQVSDALMEMEGKLNSPKNAIYLNLLISRYAELDPLGAIDFIGNNISSPWAKSSSLGAAVSTWSKRDPTGAYYWAVDNPESENDFMSSYKYSSIFKGLAKQDVNDAYSKLSGITNQGTNFHMAARGIAAVLDDSESFSTFYQQVKGLGAKRVVNSAITTWVNNDPMEVANWLENMEENKDKREMQDATLSQWVLSEPVQAVTWYMNQGYGGDTQSYANKVASSWGRTDPKQTLEWINQQPNIDKEIVTQNLLQSSVYSNIQFAIDNTELLSSEKNKKNISQKIYFYLKRSNKEQADKFVNDSLYKDYLLNTDKKKRNKKG